MPTIPILPASTRLDIDSSIARYTDAGLWMEWGLHTIRHQGSCFLLWGPPGTGKTTIAHYISAKAVKKGVLELDFANFGSQIPGENARQIRRLFEDAKRRKNCTIFLDECEAVLWSRDKIAGTNTWMLEVIDELLVRIAHYEGLIILATNRADMLDQALISRCLGNIIEVPPPAFPERIRLWNQKWPKTFPLELDDKLHHKLAEFDLTGREIEMVILDVAGRAIVQKRKPTGDDCCNVATRISALGRKSRSVRYAPSVES